MKEYLCRQWVDEVFVKLSDSEPYPSQLLDDLVVMGLTVHISLDAVERPMSGEKYVERMGDFNSRYLQYSYGFAEADVL